jgi:hypothetical protein
MYVVALRTSAFQVLWATPKLTWREYLERIRNTGSVLLVYDKQ